MEEQQLGLNRRLNKNEFYNLDHAIAIIVCPLLEDFRKAAKGYPGCLDSIEQWNDIIDKMIFSFKEIANDHENQPSIDDRKSYDKYYKRINKGLKLFYQYYGNLWI